MYDNLENGKSVRSLNIINDFNREILSITINISLPSSRVIWELEHVMGWLRELEKIRVDNGSEFIV